MTCPSPSAISFREQDFPLGVCVYVCLPGTEFLRKFKLKRELISHGLRYPSLCVSPLFFSCVVIYAYSHSQICLPSSSFSLVKAPYPSLIGPTSNTDAEPLESYYFSDTQAYNLADRVFMKFFLPGLEFSCIC